jgi:hypothetical protein
MVGVEDGESVFWSILQYHAIFRLAPSFYLGCDRDTLLDFARHLNRMNTVRTDDG